MPATLRSLRIQNLALVESLEWEVAAGFSVVTGETGAGKSVILGALKLVLGERADKSLIRTGADQCSVEALFELDEVAEINRALGDQGIEPCEEGQLLLKRIFSVSGGNRQFINGSQTTLGVLKQIGDGLVDLHGPHDHQSLLSREQQLILVDAFGDSGELLRRYQASFQEVNRLREQREKVRQQTADQNLDLWRHQLRELEAADLKPCELQILETRYHVAANSRRLMEISGSILRQLSEVDQSVLSQLTDIARQLRELNRLDESTNELLRAHEAATIELEELERGIVRYQTRLEINPEELQQMEERLNLLQSLQRKHQRDEAGLIELIEDLKARLVQKVALTYLKETVARWNSFVAKGADPDFERGPDAPMHAIATPPYYAARIVIEWHDSCGGLRINGKAQVLDMKGQVIPGLYAGGEASGAHLMHGLGKACTHGYIAASNAVNERA